MSGNLAWNFSMMAFSTSWDLPGWLDQKSIEAAGLTPLKSMSAAPVAAAVPAVDGPPQARQCGGAGAGTCQSQEVPAVKIQCHGGSSR